jgi:preprotein translocase subunit YajC
MGFSFLTTNRQKKKKKKRKEHQTDRKNGRERGCIR